MLHPCYIHVVCCGASTAYMQRTSCLYSTPLDRMSIRTRGGTGCISKTRLNLFCETSARRRQNNRMATPFNGDGATPFGFSAVPFEIVAAGRDQHFYNVATTSLVLEPFLSLALFLLLYLSFYSPCSKTKPRSPHVRTTLSIPPFFLSAACPSTRAYSSPGAYLHRLLPLLDCDLWHPRWKGD